MRGRGTIDSMSRSIAAVKADSTSLAVHADLLARMSRQRKSTVSGQQHKLAWHDAAERLADERHVAEARLSERLLAMRGGALADEVAELLRDELELGRERASTASGARLRLCSPGPQRAALTARQARPPRARAPTSAAQPDRAPPARAPARLTRVRSAG